MLVVGAVGAVAFVRVEEGGGGSAIFGLGINRWDGDSLFVCRCARLVHSIVRCCELGVVGGCWCLYLSSV